MRSRIYRLVIWVSVSVVAFVLAACSSVFVIKPMGGLKDGVTFYFYQAPEGVKRIRVRLTEFVVQEKSELSEWKTVWEVVGLQDVDAIAYGSLADGMSQRIAAVPFNVRSKYRAVAREQSLIGPPGYSAIYFEFDSDEKVIETNK